MSIQLGDKVKDTITGFSGICTAEVTYLTGCVQYEVTPPKKADGTLINPPWIDESRLEQAKQQGPARRAVKRAPGTIGKGGPQSTPTSSCPPSSVQYDGEAE